MPLCEDHYEKLETRGKCDQRTHCTVYLIGRQKLEQCPKALGIFCCLRKYDVRQNRLKMADCSQRLRMEIDCMCIDVYVKLWAQKFLEFSKGKCEVLRSGGNNLLCQCKLGADQLESGSAEKALAAQVINELNVAQHCAAYGKETQWYPGQC